MKRYVAKMLTLAAISLSACTAESGPDKFLGKWQSVRDAKRPALVIEKRGESLVIGGGMESILPATIKSKRNYNSICLWLARST
jgi:hypothetical protein